MGSFSLRQETWYQSTTSFLRVHAEKSRVIVLAILLATLISIPVTGYSVFDSDQLLYLPSVLHSLHPELYSPHDLLLSFDQGAYAPVYSKLLTLFLSLPHAYGWVFFVWLLLRFLTFYGLYRLLRYFSKDALVALLGIFVFLTGSGILENELVPRTLAVPLDLIALVFVLEGRRTLGAILIGLSFFIHPLTAVIFSFILLVRRDWRLVIPAACALALLLIHPLSHQPFFIDPTWQAILADRATFLYFTKWLGFNSTAYASVLLTLIAWPFLRKAFEGEARKNFDLLYATPFVCLLISLVAVDALNIHFVAQLQILRSFALWQLITPIALILLLAKNSSGDRYQLYLLCAALLALMTKETALFAFLPALVVLHAPLPHAKRLSAAAHTAALLGLTALSLLHIKSEPGIIPALGIIVLTSALFAWRQWTLVAVEAVAACAFVLVSMHASFYLPRWSQNADFTEACNWIQAHTHPDALFVTDVTLGGAPPLRVACDRSVYVQKKDGALGIFSRDYAVEWNRRLQNVANQNYEDAGYAFLTSSTTSMGLPLFENKTYFVYALVRPHTTSR